MYAVLAIVTHGYGGEARWRSDAGLETRRRTRGRTRDSAAAGTRTRPSGTWRCTHAGRRCKYRLPPGWHRRAAGRLRVSHVNGGAARIQNQHHRRASQLAYATHIDALSAPFPRRPKLPALLCHRLLSDGHAAAGRRL
jgi:hypothetical protein